MLSRSYQHKHFDYWRILCFGQGEVKTDIDYAHGLIYFMQLSSLYLLKFKLDESQNDILGLIFRYIFLKASLDDKHLHLKPTEVVVCCPEWP